MESSKCPKCGDEPHFIAHIEKWYCFGCNSYIGEADEDTEEGHADAEAVNENVEEPVSAESPCTECRNCGAELQDLKDGRLYCFVCETYQDEFKEPEHRENEAQTLVDQAAVQTPAAEPAVPSEPVAIQSPPGPEPKPEMVVAPAPVPEAPSAPACEAPAPVEPSPVVKTEKPVYVKMCSSCGQPLKYIDKYQRFYCYGCKKYAPKDEKLKGPADKKKCPGCGGELRFIEKYNEHYCNTCKKYPLRADKKAVPVKTEVLLCPKCKEPLKWIEKYSRHYCYSCKEYAPKGHGGTADSSAQLEKKICPSCNEAMKYIAEYDEWYCFKCRKYSLRPSKPVFLA